MRVLIIFVVLMTLVSNLTASDNDEFRSFWVITWEHISGSRTAEENKARVRKILDDVVEANMNAVLWQARQSGTAYYNSSYEPWGYYAGGSYPGYDPLAYAIEEGHKRGLEVHAWFNVFQAASTVPGAPANEHPEWICRDRDGIPMSSSIALSPGMEACREYTLNVAMEIVNNYDIDGLNLDYIRWNEYSNSKISKEYAAKKENKIGIDGIIPDYILEDLENNKAGRYLYDVDHPYSAGVPTGFGSWEEWWRWSVTQFVMALHDSIQDVKPWVRLSPCALGKYNWSGWQGYGTVYQDAALWYNEGYIDQLTPMHYHWTTPNGFYDMLEGNCPECWSQYTQTGINDGRLFTVGPGSYVFASNNVWGRHPNVINKVRTVPWTDGFQFFSYGTWEDYLYFEEAGNTFFGSKTKVRDTGLISSTSPDAPSISLLKMDSLNYKVTVTPPVSLTENQRFAVYRSEDNNIDPDNDIILNISFGDTIFSYTDSYDGLQSYNGSYYYAATTLDRYWNESVVSNTAQGDPLPSFAPVIVQTYPQLPDTINFNTSIAIDFSKEMNETSVEAAITFDPVVQIDQFAWSDDSKSVTIVNAENFQFATDYTLNIAATAADVNGRLLDGNGDGNGGDPWSVAFVTKDEDAAGPVLVYSYPDFASAIDTFGVAEKITLNFNEELNVDSIEDTTFSLKKGSQDLTIDYVITAAEYSNSLISIGTFEDLNQDTEYQLEVKGSITDTAGNPFGSDMFINFRTIKEHYVEQTLIDDFVGAGDWKAPGYSGSTVGIVVSNTVFGYAKKVYPPGTWTVPIKKKSGFLKYEWMQDSPSYLIREYLAGGSPREVVFDTTWTLECYVYGDNSKNKFRLALDEGDGSNWPNHEVSQWVTIDWYGWKLLRWDLSDPNSVGTWIGNGLMDGSSYRIDSFQMTHDSTNGAVLGRIYVDELRLVKTSTQTSIEEFKPFLPQSVALSQNYPNPFNPSTKIKFGVKESGPVSLKVYDLLGRLVKVLVDERLNTGEYTYKFTASRDLASGTYVYVLKASGKVITRKMVYLK